MFIILEGNIFRLVEEDRLQQSQQEDDDFQRQLSSILSRVDISKNRASVYDMISNMEVPKVPEANGH
ncbi:unnamed protein product [Toxocara canis]|uniref:Transcriptional regulator n=1 Tax=Toxocara canis TaxID=6265 RepID=A0A183UKT2_TOXCA|nr:unnamed protein product [Toxocara canis]